MLGFLEPSIVGLLLESGIRVAILREITLLILLLVMLGKLIWVPIIVWLLLTIVTSWSSGLLMFYRHWLSLANLAWHLIMVLMLLKRLMWRSSCV